MEQWRRLAALHDPFAAGRILDDNRQILCMCAGHSDGDLCLNMATLDNHGGQDTKVKVK